MHARKEHARPKRTRRGTTYAASQARSHIPLPLYLWRIAFTVGISAGCCIKMLNFSDKEFVDTISFELDAHAHPPTAARNAKKRKYSEQQGLQEDNVAAYHHKPNSNHPQDPALKYLLRAHSTEQQQQQQHLLLLPTLHSSAAGAASFVMPSSVNKKNRYRSWVHHRMQVNSTSFKLPACGSRLLQQRASANAATHDRSSTSNDAWNLEDHTEHVRSMIEMYVWDMLCSRKWDDSMLMEVSAGHNAVVLQACDKKCSCQPPHLPGSWGRMNGKEDVNE